MTSDFTWSYSALKNFETCPKRYAAYQVEKSVREPESEALRSGNALHRAFEARLKHATPLPLGMGMHEKLLAKLANTTGVIYAEQKLALTAEFKPSAWFGKATWFRSVLDYTVVRPDHTASIIDYKTGRPAEDTTQLALMAVTLFHHDTRLERVKAALLFVAYDQVERAEYVREDVTEIWSEILPRVNKLRDARQAHDYPPKPGALCRKWCSVTACPFHGR